MPARKPARKPEQPAAPFADHDPITARHPSAVRLEAGHAYQRREFVRARALYAIAEAIATVDPRELVAARFECIDGTVVDYRRDPISSDPGYEPEPIPTDDDLETIPEPLDATS